MKQIIFTQEGFDNLGKEYNELSAQRIDAVKELKMYREMGDLSENAAYRAARSKLSRIDSRLRFLKNSIDSAVVKKPSNSDYVDIGNTIIVESEKQTFTYTIVGKFESNISLGKLSYLSPLGKEVIGKKAGDLITIHTPSGIKKYVIISIHT